MRALAELRERLSEAESTLYRAAPAALIAPFWRTLAGTERGGWLWTGSTTMRHNGQQAGLDPGLLSHAIVQGRAIPPTGQLLASCGTARLRQSAAPP
jgi:hypothetical protein